MGSTLSVMSSTISDNIAANGSGGGGGTQMRRVLSGREDWRKRLGAINGGPGPDGILGLGGNDGRRTTVWLKATSVASAPNQWTIELVVHPPAAQR